jgi:hypothetical protein
MKKILYFMLLMIVTNNFLIFIFGLVFAAKAAKYERTQQENYILDSALTLAIQAREDNRIVPALEAEFALQNRAAGYTVRKLDNGGDYIKVFIKKGNEILFREYLKPLSQKPVIIPLVEAVPRITPSPTVIPVTALKIPGIGITPTPAAAEWFLIK